MTPLFIKIKKSSIRILTILFIISGTLIIFPSLSESKIKYTCGSAPATDGKYYSNCACGFTCEAKITECSKGSCECQSNKDTPITIKHITDEFIQHRKWLIKVLWEAHVLPSMMLMTEQISAVAMQQMLILGTLFDAKHQLESQRLLQDLQAQAHKDYQPSKGMCQFGTNTRSLAASDRNVDLTQIAIASRATQRNLLNGEGISGGGPRNDSKNRLVQFKSTYCNKADYGNGMGLLCKTTNVDRINRDIDFTAAMDQESTLEIDFSDSETTANEADVMALSANLYGHELFPYIYEGRLALRDGRVIRKGTFAYMKIRALMAKRSVAQAAFAAQAAMKSQGTKSVAPYMQAILEEMGIKEEDAIEMVGDRPSYEAQMTLLTKTLYQTPQFYTELYDKPTNIDRKIVSMQAVNLMQRRDAYRSNLRREAIEAVWLETALSDLEEEVKNNIYETASDNKIIDINGLD
jgi:hypothetical protein